MKALWDRSDDVRSAAVDALVGTRDPAVPERIKEDWLRLRDTRWAIDSYVRILGRSGGAAALMAVMDLPSEGFYGDVEKAVEKELMALGDVGVNALVKAVTDQQATADVRGFAASALGRAKIGAAVQLLIEALNDPDGHVRKKAASALAEIGDQRAVVPLLTAPNSYFSPMFGEQRSVNFDSDLERLVDRRSVGLLLAMLNDNEGKRGLAVRLLGKIGDAQTVEALIRALNDESSDVRIDAVLALEAIADIRAVEPLCAALADPDHNVRKVAASALASFSDSRSAVALGRFLLSLPVDLRHRDYEIEKACWAALARLQHPLTVRPLLERAVSDTRRSKEALDILMQILVNSAASVSSEDLRAVADLNEVSYEYSISSEEYIATRREKIDCSELRRTATLEMSRRGLT